MEDKDILEVGRFLYDNYPGFNSSFPIWKLLSIVDRNADKVVYVRDRGVLKGAAFYLKLTDQSLHLVDLGVISLKERDIVENLIQEDGDNVHFVCVLADNAKTILKGLRQVIKKESPKTISWFKPDMDKIHFVKLRSEMICLPQ